ncbi:AMP-activated serine/threonine-protein kinase regulatory subunit [Nowakowskiella sp. JEL0407]|nr:AMP-activated serine/threonine-protein kinase regulatory subunit [Nowakowskiella sp. JEL0407]
MSSPKDVHRTAPVPISSHANYRKEHSHSPMIENEPVLSSLKRHTCYDLLPVSHKVIVFDTSLLLKKALAALLQHGVQSAPLWDSAKQKFAGMLSVTDFINLIIYYYDHASYEAAIEEIEQLQISTLREFEIKLCLLSPICITIHPSDSLFDAAKLLMQNNLHRLPMLDTSEEGEIIVSVITQYKILKYLAANNNDEALMTKTLRELNIGTYTNLQVAYPNTPLIEILHMFISKKISAVPIVAEDLTVLDVYEKYDVLALARESTYSNLKMPVGEALLKRWPDFEGIHSCTLSDTLGDIMETMRRMPVHRFVVLENNKLIGLVSLSDILGFLLNTE